MTAWILVATMCQTVGALDTCKAIVAPMWFPSRAACLDVMPAAIRVGVAAAQGSVFHVHADCHAVVRGET